jgi:surface protein
MMEADAGWSLLEKVTFSPFWVLSFNFFIKNAIFATNSNINYIKYRIMKKKSLLFRLFAVVAAMMCALGIQAQEAYACYTSDNTTLTFYYDNYRSLRPGTTYDLNTGTTTPGWETDRSNLSVTQVVFDSSFAGARPTTTYDWFYNMGNLQSITGMSYLNTSDVTNMSYMFDQCNQLTSIDVSHFNTANVTKMTAMFTACSSLTSLDLSSFNTSQVTDMRYMFNVCSNLQTIYVGDGWSTTAVTSSTNMFGNCTSLVGGKGTTWDSSNPTDATYAHIDGGTSNPGYFSDINPIAYACYTESNTTLTFYYDTQRYLRPGTTYDLNEGSNNPGWVTDRTNASVTKVVFKPSFADARPTTTYSWFYRMAILQSIEGIEYLNTSEVTNMAWMISSCTELTSLDLSHFNTSNVTIMGAMFYGCSGLTSLDLSHFNTSKVTDMGSMFNKCSNLTSLDLSSFNTSNVTKMGGMFYDNSNLQTIYVGIGWSTAAVTYSTNMFYNCTSLVGGMGTTYDENHVEVEYAHIDGGSDNPGYFTAATEAYACYTSDNTMLTFFYDTQRSTRPGTTYDLNKGNHNPGWVTDGTYASVTQVVFDPSFADARPTTTYWWFGAMFNLQSITGMSYLNTSEVTDMTWMFGYCESMTSLDLSSFNTSKVTDMSGMFQDCSNLQTIYVGNGWSTAAVTSSDDMFYDCTRLVGGQGTTWYSDNPRDKTYAHIDGGPSNPGYFTDKNALIAYACYTPENTTLTFYYDNQHSSRPGTTYFLNTGDYPGWETDGTYASVTQVVFDPSFADARPTTTYCWFYEMSNLVSITGISYLNTSEVTNMSLMFPACTHLTSLDLSSFNTSQVTDMSGMFQNCSSLTSLDVSGFNTSKVTDMRYMFLSCRSLTSLDLSSFNTSQVTKMYSMFQNCSSLTSLDLSSFNTSQVTKMYSMFQNCSSLTSLDVSGFNTANVTSMDDLFNGCSSLTSLDVSGFNTANVKSMERMFAGCSSLTSLDLSSFNTSKVTEIVAMFRSCSNLQIIYAGNGWSTAAVTYSNYMFEGCTSLVGGMGTTYDADHIDASYAHIDGGPDNPGYFTEKPAFKLGDVNGDGVVDIDDVTMQINVVLGNPVTGFISANADLNGDERIDIDDVTLMINMVLGN